jgi:uncharacterized membrane protein
VLEFPDGLWPLLAVPAIAAGALWTRAVTVSGALAGCAVGAAIAAGAGWPGIAMLGTLLAVGTLCSARTSRRRDAFQVLGNGAVAGAGALLGQPLVVAGALAAALSDSLSSELGKRFGGIPCALLCGRALSPGDDGGMTVLGTLFGVAGALLVPLAGWAAGGVTFAALWTVAAAGLFGNFADSVFGLVAQRFCGARGNDWTNLVATAVGGLAALALRAAA